MSDAVWLAGNGCLSGAAAGKPAAPAYAHAATGFRTDPRFAAAPSHGSRDPQDALTAAYQDGFAAGLAEARAHAEVLEREDDAARAGLALSFARLDAQLEEELRLRLRDTVAALCESALAPLALDGEALAGRIEQAVSMLARADDERVIRLHPDDIALVSPRLCSDWQVQADDTLQRGAVRVECANGGVEDGPGQWRRAIAEALHQC